MATVTLTEAQFEALSTAFNTLAEAFSNGKPATNGSAKAGTRRTKVAAPEPVEEEVAEAEEEISPEEAAVTAMLESERGEELAGLSLPKLRKLAIGLGYDEEGVADSDQETLIGAIITAEEEVDAEAADGDEVDEAEAEEEEVSEADEDDAPGEPEYEDLDAMGIRALRKFVTDTWGDVSEEIDVAKASKQEIMDWVFPPEAAEEEAEEDSTEEAEAEGLTVEELNAMSIADLRKVVKDYGGAPKPGAKKPELIRLINDLADVQY